MQRFSRFLIGLLWVTLGMTSPVVAADGKGPDGSFRFAVINLQHILREAAATQTIRPQIEKLKKTYQDRFEKYEEELRAANQDLQRQRTIITPEAYADRLKLFKERVNKRQREVQSVQRMLDKAGSDALGKVHRKFREITVELAKERSIELIVPRSGLLYVDPRYDISEEVLKRLNQQLPSVTVVIPESLPDEGADTPDRK
jgi:Skp family chaperone for outer membrane proteins